MQPYLYILIGLPGVGKSTWIKQNIHQNTLIDIKVISADEYIEQVAKESNQTYNDVYPANAATASKYFYDTLKSLIAENHTVMCDRTHLSRVTRKNVLDLVPKHYKKLAINFTCERSLWEQRLMQRPGKVIPVDVLTVMQAAYEEPTFEEGFDEIVTIFTDKNTEQPIWKPNAHQRH